MMKPLKTIISDGRKRLGCLLLIPLTVFILDLGRRAFQDNSQETPGEARKPRIIEAEPSKEGIAPTLKQIESAKSLLAQVRTLRRDLQTARNKAEEAGWTEEAVREYSQEFGTDFQKRHSALEAAINDLAEKPISPLFPVKADLTNALFRVWQLRNQHPNSSNSSTLENTKFFEEETASAERTLSEIADALGSETDPKTKDAVILGAQGTIDQGTDVYNSFEAVKEWFDSYDFGDEEGINIRSEIVKAQRVEQIPGRRLVQILEIRAVSLDPMVTALKVAMQSEDKPKDAWILKNRFIVSSDQSDLSPDGK